MNPGAGQLVASNADFLAATWHQTVVVIYKGIARTEDVRRGSLLCQSVVDAKRGPVTYIGVVERSSPAPAEPVRREMAAWSRDVVPPLALAVMVAEGGGFKSALVRGVGVALTVIAPHRVPFKFTQTVEEAIELTVPFLPAATGGASELSREIARLRAEWLV